MQLVRVAIMAATMFGVNTVSGADEKWDYPAGRHGINQVSAGKAGHIRVFNCETTDTPEKVILWYAKRLELDNDHSLFEAASKGFDRLQEDTHIQHGFGHDTEDRRNHTQMVAHIRDGQAHVSFLHRPDFQLSSVVTISIAGTPAGTSVHVIQPMIVSD